LFSPSKIRCNERLSIKFGDRLKTVKRFDRRRQTLQTTKAMPEKEYDSPGVGQTQREIIAGYMRAFPETDVNLFAVQFAFSSAATYMREGVEKKIREIGFNLSQSRFRVVRMLYLADGHELPKREIAAGLHASGAYVAQLLSTLQADGWIERSANAADRRESVVRLTPEGFERCDRLVPQILEYMVGTWMVLTPEEREEIQRILAKILPEVEVPMNKTQ
jgi:DNA-binding MarR family transcriptional regulator